MRNTRLIVLVALGLPLVATLGGCDVATEFAAQVRGAEGEGDATSTASEAGGDTNVYYQYVDDSGSVRFVQSRGEIPAKYRANAGRIELEKSRPAAATAPTPAPTRSIWQKAAEAPWQRSGGGEVVMYTAPWCGVCRRAEAFFDRNDVRFTAKDIDANPAYKQELIDKTGRSAIPVIEVEGERLVGFDQRRLERLLSL